MHVSLNNSTTIASQSTNYIQNVTFNFIFLASFRGKKEVWGQEREGQEHSCSQGYNCTFRQILFLKYPGKVYLYINCTVINSKVSKHVQQQDPSQVFKNISGQEETRLHMYLHYYLHSNKF